VSGSTVGWTEPAHEDNGAIEDVGNRFIEAADDLIYHAILLLSVKEKR
jgi:hypothetical protein